jgi:hypothetical protein
MYKILIYFSTLVHSNKLIKNHQERPTNIKANKFLVIAPYKFSKFNWDKLELSELKLSIDVEVWDLSRILHPKWSKVLQYDQLEVENLHLFVDIKEFIFTLKKFINENIYNNVCIYNGIPNSNLIEFITNQYLKFILKKTNFKVFDLISPGLPPNINKSKNTVFILKVIENIIKIFKLRSNLKNFYLVLSSYFISSLNKLSSKYLTHLLVAGDYYASLQANRVNTETKLIKINTPDFSQHLRSIKKKSIDNEEKQKCLVYLDSPDPFFNGDYELVGETPAVTASAWYPSVCEFLSKLEAKFDLPTIICGHPKTQFESTSKLYGGRKVVYGKTYENVNNCKLVITKYSMSISYAVIFQKPILHIISDEMLNSKSGLKQIREMKELSVYLGSSIHNINRKFRLSDNELIVNQDLYRNYIDDFLISKSHPYPNYEIILRDVMKIKY